jgi:quinol monooxygenase YgiN
MTYKTAQFEVKADSLEKCRQAIREFIDYIRQSEPTTKLYLSLEQSDRPGQFLHVMRFEDNAAEERHAKSEACRKFTSVLYPELDPAKPDVEFKPYTALASNQS